MLLEFNSPTFKMQGLRSGAEGTPCFGQIERTEPSLLKAVLPPLGKGTA